MGWQQYSVTLNKTPIGGIRGFIVVLSTALPNASPAEMYVLLTSPATYVRQAARDATEVADAQIPALLFPSATVESSIGAPTARRLPPSSPP
eukprot:4761652-Prymnesium_polylepis.1